MGQVEQELDGVDLLLAQGHCLEHELTPVEEEVADVVGDDVVGRVRWLLLEVPGGMLDQREDCSSKGDEVVHKDRERRGKTEHWHLCKERALGNRRRLDKKACHCDGVENSRPDEVERRPIVYDLLHSKQAPVSTSLKVQSFQAPVKPGSLAHVVSRHFEVAFTCGIPSFATPSSSSTPAHYTTTATPMLLTTSVRSRR